MHGTSEDPALENNVSKADTFDKKEVQQIKRTKDAKEKNTFSNDVASEARFDLIKHDANFAPEVSKFSFTFLISYVWLMRLIL